MTLFDFRFQKAPVIAFKLPMTFMLEAVEGVTLSRPKRIVEPWVVLNATGKVHFLADEEFLPLYEATNEATQAYLDATRAVGL